jgi:hypothetical protein
MPSSRDIPVEEDGNYAVGRSCAFFRSIRNAGLASLLLAAALCPQVYAKGMLSACPLKETPKASRTIAHSSLPEMEPPAINEVSGRVGIAFPQLIVIGFMGGHIRAGNLVHREALLAKDLQQHYPLALHAEVFANRDGDVALKAVLQQVDKNGDGCLSAEEKNTARIIIFGHSWGASETVTLARRLNELNIPVLLTVQVDSVQKPSENDERIPPNVREAVNFYQTEGLLHGRSQIVAADPKQTAILGNFASTYRENPVSCPGYPWYARAFMRPHIEIENDPRVWDRIEAIISTKVAP